MELFPETPDATIGFSAKFSITLLTSASWFMKLSTALAIELGGGQAAYISQGTREFVKSSIRKYE